LIIVDVFLIKYAINRLVYSQIIMTLMNPKISIITISYNSERTIEDALKSFFAQSYENKEYVVIDGGSKDSTTTIIDKYKDHIGFFVSEKDNGISDAFNKGIQHCTGDIIGILNSDDMLIEGALGAIANNYDPTVDVYRGNLLYWDEKTGTKFIMRPNMNFKLIPFNPHICHGASFITKKAYDKYGVYKDYKYLMDLDLFIRLYYGGAKFKFINKAIVIFRLGGVSSDSESLKKEERRRVIIENGGSKLQANIYVLFHKVKKVMKKVMNIFLGRNSWFALRYKKI